MVRKINLSESLGDKLSAALGQRRDKSGASFGSSVATSADGTKTAFGEMTGTAGIIPFIGDTTPPPVPSKPQCDGYSGVLVVRWDGGWATSVEATPPDFAGIIVEVKGPDVGDWTVLDRTIRAAGSVPIPVEAGIYSVRLRSYDNAHNDALDGAPNVSEPSGMTLVVVEDVPGSAQEAQDVAEQAAENAVKALTQSQTALDGRQAVVKLISSRGTTFKNNAISTDITATIFYAEKTITDIADLTETFGAGAFLEWKWRRMDDEDWQTISSADTHISAGGFTFTVSPDDVDAQTSFTCILNV